VGQCQGTLPPILRHRLTFGPLATIAREPLVADGFSVFPTRSQRFFGNAIIAADKSRFT